ncbi:AAA family ATPase [Blastococcus sp. SYSU D00695]
MLSEVRIKRFKSLGDVSVPLGKITVLVGPNNAGKSSLLQAIQFATSICQSLQVENVSAWSRGARSGTLSAQQLIYTPLRALDALAMGGRLRQDSAYAIGVELRDDSANETIISVIRGKNRNISVRVSGENLGRELEDLTNPYSVVAPGLAGIPSVEEFKSPGVVRRAAARGDANSVFRNVLWTLRRDPDQWAILETRLAEIFPDVALRLQFDDATDEYIRAEVNRGEEYWLPIDSAGTGVLQALQVLSYVGVYGPKLLILDEPDSHLHPDNQRKLARLLRLLVDETETQVLLSTHSRHMLDEFGRLGATVHWISDGKRQDGEFDQVSALLDLGALDAGDRLRHGSTPVVVLTEDTETEGLRTLLLSSGLQEDDYQIWSYAGSSNLSAASVLGRFIMDIAPGTVVIVHRDRDYLTDVEAVRYEEVLREQGLHPFLTHGTDVESHFLDVGYLQECYPHLSGPDVASILDQATRDMRDK